MSAGHVYWLRESTNTQYLVYTFVLLQILRAWSWTAFNYYFPFYSHIALPLFFQAPERITGADDLSHPSIYSCILVLPFLFFLGRQILFIGAFQAFFFLNGRPAYLKWLLKMIFGIHFFHY